MDRKQFSQVFIFSLAEGAVENLRLLQMQMGD